MPETKYKYNASLVEYDLCLEIFDSFNLKVSDLLPTRNAFLVKTDKGDKLLKKIDFSEEELKYIKSAVNYIKKDFQRISDFVETKEKSISLIYGNKLYCILDIIDGKKCDYGSGVDIGIAAKGLGELHKASEGFRYNLNSRTVNGKIISFIKRKKEELELFKNIINLYEKKNEFDEIFMDNVDYYTNKIDNSLEILAKSQYFKLCSEEDKIALCHHDLIHHNILIQNEEAYFIDFDSAIIDLKVHDLSNFINNVKKNESFDMEKAALIIHNYCESSSLDLREAEVLYGLLSFPEEFYNISKDYYSRRKKWDEESFVIKLKKKLEGREKNEEVLKGFKTILIPGKKMLQEKY